MGLGLCLSEGGVGDWSGNRPLQMRPSRTMTAFGITKRFLRRWSRSLARQPQANPPERPHPSSDNSGGPKQKVGTWPGEGRQFTSSTRVGGYCSQWHIHVPGRGHGGGGGGAPIHFINAGGGLLQPVAHPRAGARAAVQTDSGSEGQPPSRPSYDLFRWHCPRVRVQPSGLCMFARVTGVALCCHCNDKSVKNETEP